MLCSLTLLSRDEQLVLLIGDDHDDFRDSGIDRLESIFTELFIEVDPFNQNQILSQSNKDIINGIYAVKYRK